jgi:hypothetical protein
MIGPMRRLLVLFMIVLLPLRGWAGDLMSVQMAMSNSVSASMDAAMSPGCPMHSEASQDDSGPDADGSQSQGGMKNCVSCGLCVPIAELAHVRFDDVAFAGHAQPVIGAAQFVSASLAPTVKPPIF